MDINKFVNPTIPGRTERARTEHIPNRICHRAPFVSPGAMAEGSVFPAQPSRERGLREWGRSDGEGAREYQSEAEAAEQERYHSEEWHTVQAAAAAALV